MALLLIRHGETALNAARVVQFPDTPLGETGMNQAEQLGRHLAARPVRLVLSSDYTRARMTADRVAHHTGAALVESAHLRERNFGDYRGTAYDDHGEVDLFAADFHPPNGESWGAFHDRVDRAWDEVGRHADGGDGDIAVVTHGLVLRSLLERVLDIGAHVLGDEIAVANTSVTVVDHLPPWRVLELASVAHLAGGPNDVAPA